MKTFLFEATNGDFWGKFLVGMMDDEWHWYSQISKLPDSLLRQRGWSGNHIWVMDLETGEGALFQHGGYAPGDLNEHKIRVCLLFRPFLCWLYKQDLAALSDVAGSVLHLDHAQDELDDRRQQETDTACPVKAVS